MHDVAIVIPVYNEYKLLKSKLRYFRHLEATFRELLFVDGGSSDGSAELLQKQFFVISSPPGRAVQMNAGAKKASSTTVLFLHVDAMLPGDFDVDSINTALWGFFHITLSGRNWMFRLVEKGIQLRSKVFQIGTGDQCLFFNRLDFIEQGGFADQPLMEDVDISRRYKKRTSPVIVVEPVVASSRRWEKHGVIRTIMLMWTIQLMYKLGVSPFRLARWYGYTHLAKNRQNAR